MKKIDSKSKDRKRVFSFGNMLNDQKGFSLIELVLATSMVLFLSSMAVMGTSHARERARMAQLYADIHRVKMAAQQFEQDVGFYPLDVTQNVDPSFVDKYGYLTGGHSGQWDLAEAQGLLSDWSGPYLEKWPRNPWGGTYEWDNYPPGFDFMGIQGGAVFLSLKPSAMGGKDGLPPIYYEGLLEKAGVDVSPSANCVLVQLGKYPN